MKLETMKFEEPEHGLGLARLNRPDSMNAFNRQMVDDFYALFDWLRHNKQVRVLILTGEGRGFCSGFDLRDESLMTPAGLAIFKNTGSFLEEMMKVFAEVIIEMRRLPQPIIATVMRSLGAARNLLPNADAVRTAGAAVTVVFRKLRRETVMANSLSAGARSVGETAGGRCEQS